MGATFPHEALRPKRCSSCGGTGLHRFVDPQWLRARRKAAGRSLRDLGRQLGLSAPYLSDVELGRRSITTEHKIAIAYLRLAK